MSGIYSEMISFFSSIKSTLKIQPAVILFSCVSIIAKIASGMLPKGDLSVADKILAVMTDWCLLGVVALMFLILGIYAAIWQMLIKKAQIAVVYANKASCILWAQLAAASFFREHITWTNIFGIIIIFSGILLANGGHHESA